MKNLEKILEFYRKTSSYTDLGFYKEFAKNLPENTEKLCLLQRHQIIHPFNLIDETRQNKVHVTCRGQAILLASILKAKGIPTRARSGFAEYTANKGIYWDHWITEYFDKTEQRWILVDADCCCNDIDFNPYDLPREKFLFGANAWLGVRQKEYKEDNICYASDPVTIGLKAAIRGLFYDFHCLMNDEIIFLHMPKYIRDKNFELSEEEYQELDKLAKLMLNPNKNFEELKKIWEKEDKFRIMSGALN